MIYCHSGFDNVLIREYFLQSGCEFQMPKLDNVDDILQLKRLGSFTEGGFVELARLAKGAGIKNHGLRGLASVLLGFRISKGAQRSNWDNETLKNNQVRYAATDAWVGRELYKKLKQM